MHQSTNYFMMQLFDTVYCGLYLCHRSYQASTSLCFYAPIWLAYVRDGQIRSEKIIISVCVLSLLLSCFYYCTLIEQMRCSRRVYIFINMAIFIHLQDAFAVVKNSWPVEFRS